MNQLTDAGYTAYVGIDWAAAKHDICVQAAEGGAREFTCAISNGQRNTLSENHCFAKILLNQRNS